MKNNRQEDECLYRCVCSKNLDDEALFYAISKYHQVIENGFADILYAESSLFYCQGCAEKRDFSQLSAKRNETAKYASINSEPIKSNYHGICEECEKIIYDNDIHWIVGYEKMSIKEGWINVFEAYIVCSFCETCQQKYDLDKIEVPLLR